MPVVGTVDIVMGLAVLVSPRPFILIYMAVWALWTALLRPLAGEPLFETMERAGNYGVPLALLLMVGLPSGWRTRGNWRGWSGAGDGVAVEQSTIARVLLWTTAILLFGHGALAAITGKAVFATHYTALGMSPGIAPMIGYAEMVAALVVLVVPKPWLLISIAVWQLATEALFPLAGSPVWELIERGRSYAAPLSLALLTMHRGVSPVSPLSSRGRPS